MERNNSSRPLAFRSLSVGSIFYPGTAIARAEERQNGNCKDLEDEG